VNTSYTLQNSLAYSSQLFSAPSTKDAANSALGMKRFPTNGLLDTQARVSTRHQQKALPGNSPYFT
jgi:hypothetical protein